MCVLVLEHISDFNDSVTFVDAAATTTNVTATEAATAACSTTTTTTIWKGTISRYCPGFWLEYLCKRRKSAARMANVPVRIRTKHFPVNWQKLHMVETGKPLPLWLLEHRHSLK
jgi:hypothetical protein